MYSLTDNTIFDQKGNDQGHEDRLKLDGALTVDHGRSYIVAAISATDVVTSAKKVMFLPSCVCPPVSEINQVVSEF